MSDSTNKTVASGVSVMIAVIFAIVGVGFLDSAQLNQEFQIDSETEWNNYAATLDGVVVNTNGYVELEATNTSGTYTSVTLDANESTANRYHVYASVPEPGNSSATLVVSGNSYELQDGVNKFDVTAGSSFSLEFQRDSTGVESPNVDSVTGLSGADSGGLLRLVGVAAFGLLLLLVVLQYMGFSGMGRRKQ